MIAAIIPARGGSKGIPRKNLTPVCGLPLVLWSVRQAQAATHIDRVIVATDCTEIAAVCDRAGATIFHRSADSASDTAPSEQCIIEAIREMDLANYEAIVFLQATSPCRQRNEIDEAIGIFRAAKADSLFSARIVDGYLWQRSRREPDKCSPIWIEARGPRQQHLYQNVEENGSLYIAKPWVILNGSRHGGKTVPYLMHPLDSYQIDEPQDVELLEQLMEVRLGCHATAAT